MIAKFPNVNFAELRRNVADFISPESAAERRSLERLVNVDALTGVANRRAFDLAQPTAELDDRTAFVFFDANNFGKLNKAAGHKYGDLILKEMAAFIVAQAIVFGVPGRVFRLGGDEFVVLCKPEHAARLRDFVETGFGVRFPAVGVSISGCYGPTLEAAENGLQARKAARKAGRI